MQTEQYETGTVIKVLKVLFVGDMGTGKTSIVRQYVQGNFSEFYKTSIGVDFATKDLEWDEKTKISLQLWDIAGQERYGKMTRVYYQDSVAAFVVFDITRLPTLDMVEVWKKDIEEKVKTSEGVTFPCVLLANKIDLNSDGNWGKTKEEMEEFCKANGFLTYFETSARLGTNLSEAVNYVVDYIMKNNIEPMPTRDDSCVELSSSTKNEDNGKCC